jgi:hypothetical protein
MGGKLRRTSSLSLPLGLFERKAKSDLEREESGKKLAKLSTRE